MKVLKIREMYVILMIVITVIFVSVFSSMAIFQKVVEQKEVAQIVINELKYKISSTESSFKTYGSYGTITVPAGTNKYFDITIENEETINTKYKMYYRFTNGVTIIGTEVGISDKEEDGNGVKYAEESGIITTEEKVIRVGIKNGSNQSVTIEIGVQGGYETNQVILNSSRNELKEISESFDDPSGANAPVLAEGMIPVVYNEATGNWEKADTNEEWYNYGKQMWANAVTVGSTWRTTYMNASSGTVIPIVHINSMWVWIPRYKYRIPSNIGSGVHVTTPPQIDVVFESGTNTTGSSLSSCPITSTSCYYTHPAFRDGSKVYKNEPYDIGGWDEELPGIWVGKFETGETTAPIIRPNIESLWYQDISTKFDISIKFAGGTRNTSTGEVTFKGNNSYGLTSSTDTHMMKNTEWGAVAYLSQSKYGKNGNSNYTGANKEIYINNSSSYYTGRSGGSPNAEETDYGSYSYDDKTCTTSTCTGSKVENAGVGASTTGTIYGIYDMSGGLDEITMSNWEGEVGYTDFTTNNLPGGSNGSKYYEKYTGPGSLYLTVENAIKGDATYETRHWYSDDASSPGTYDPWFSRSGNYNTTSNAGVFNTNNNSAPFYSITAFRVVLIP